MNKERQALQIITQTIYSIQENPLLVKDNGCAACHVLFTLSKEMKINEQDASDLLSEILLSNPGLDDAFIDMVENIHMKKRLMGTSFAIKTRDAKNNFIYSNFKNTLAELHSDVINYGPEITLRRLILSAMSLEIAKNIGIDYHASTEELYYYLRKNEQEADRELLEFIHQFHYRVIKQNKK